MTGRGRRHCTNRHPYPVCGTCGAAWQPVCPTWDCPERVAALRIPLPGDRRRRKPKRRV